MVDVFSRRVRSEIMSKVHPRGNKTTELVFLQVLRAAGITGWRRHLRIVGCPDFVFRAHRLAVFVDGCFWHGCTKCRSIPKQNRKFWQQKLEYNRKRARKVNVALGNKGWTVLRLWEHELKDSAKILKILRREFMKHSSRASGGRI